MPNHVINILSFEGDKTKIRQMLEDIKDDEYGLHSVDFNKIIPMPPSLDLEASSRTQAGLAAYKDFIDVYTLGGTINTEHLSDIPVASEQRFLKVRTDINHEDFALGKQAWNNLRQYGAATWYDWCYANWGTKWNAYGYDGYEPASMPDDCIWFQTAWAEPKPVIEALARRYPDITIEHEWANEDLGEGCGRRVYENGDEIEEYYPKGEVESVEYAASVWKYDFCDLGMAKNKTGTRYIHTDYDEYECIEICGKPALFTDERLTEDEIPEGMYLYHLRERDDGDGFATLEANYDFSVSDLTVTPDEIEQYGKVTVKFRVDNWDRNLPYANVPVEVLLNGEVIYSTTVNFSAHGVQNIVFGLNVGASLGTQTLVARINWVDHESETRTGNNSVSTTFTVNAST